MRIFLIAGEPSGDQLGAAVMAGLRDRVSEIRFDGVGGPAMEREGLRSRFPMAELSVMGIAEILPRYRQLKRRIAETAQAVLDDPPDALLTIDSPDFCLRVAKIVKGQRDIPVIHYVAPSVWAWRPKRAAKMARSVDHVLALLPFEPPYMEAEGMGCDFVGHPIAAEPQATEADIARFRDGFDLGEAPIVLALPGSRQGEVKRLAPAFGPALAEALRDRPGTRVVVPTVAHLADTVTEAVKVWPGAPVVLDPRAAGPDFKKAAFAAAEVALAASGTVSLELAAAGTPMVIAYRFNWLSQRIIERMLTVDTVTLVNLVSETRLVPECIGNECRPGPIAAALRSVMASPDAQSEALELTMDRLGRGGPAPGIRAADAVLRAIRGA
ncbi:MAG: lipid-A-disaccharide synthase [Pseudomonadota bacterium]